ncbi:hypothetical protein DID98_28645 [Burkholderia sp. Bp8984]|nr:hypothetical protein DID98_28645 [Burkholderia sp. Bp8984]
MGHFGTIIGTVIEWLFERRGARQQFIFQTWERVLCIQQIALFVRLLPFKCAPFRWSLDSA